MEPKAALNCEHLKKLVREVPDFPKPGILFYDITTLLKDKGGFATLIDALSEHYINHNVDLVLGIEARGFIFGPALAYRLNAGFVPIRKPRKLPAETVKWTYDLEYGTDTLEIHKDAIKPGQRVIVDGQYRVIPNSKVEVVRTVPVTTGPKQVAENGSASGEPQ